MFKRTFLSGLIAFGTAGILSTGLLTANAASSTTSGSKTPFVGNANQTYYVITFLSGIEYWKV